MGEELEHKDSLDGADYVAAIVRDSPNLEDTLSSMHDLLPNSLEPPAQPAARPSSGSLKKLGADGGSLQSALSSMLHSAEDLLAASHGRALALAAEHAEALRQAQDEAARLRLENDRVRTALARRTEMEDVQLSDGLLLPHLPGKNSMISTNGSILRDAALVDGAQPAKGARPSAHFADVEEPQHLPRQSVQIPAQPQPQPPVEDCPSLPGHTSELEEEEPRPTRVMKAFSRSIISTVQNGQGDKSQPFASSLMTRNLIDSFEVLPDWKMDATQSRLPNGAARKLVTQQTVSRSSRVSALMRTLSGSSASAVTPTVSGNAMEYELGLVRVGSQRWWIIHPLSNLRAALDAFSLIFVFYDLIFIPLAFFELDRTTFMVFMEWCVRLFWTFDMVVSFLKGLILSDGTIEMRPPHIARHYLKSWFVFDVAVNSIDWFELISSGDGGGNASLTRSMRSFRGIRALRLVRLLRLLRLKEVVEMLGERINSHWIQLLFSISKNALAIVAIAHVLACCWYGIASNSGEKNWVVEYNFDGVPFGDVYSMALLWALAQFAGGTDEITAVNLSERSYNIACFILAFVMGAVFIGNLTSSMTQLHILGSQNNKELSVLRQFLCQNKVSQMLMLRVQRNASRALEEEMQHMEEERVGLLFRVSEPLRIEIHFEMYSPMLRSHKFLSGYSDTYPQVMRRVCHAAMTMANLSPGDIIFNAGEIPSPPRMYIAVEGEMEYRSIFSGSYRVTKKQYVSEGTLWTSWAHVGTFLASTPAQLCKLDAQEFRKIVTRFHHDDVHFNPCVYAANFVKALRGMEELSDLTGIEEF